MIEGVQNNNLNEAIKFHNISQESQSFFTSNQNIINIAQNILGSDYQYFVIKDIKTSSLEIIFKDIKNTCYHNTYLKNKNKNIMAAIGGPAAEEQIILAVINSNIKKKFDEIIYITKNYLESNSHHSTKQIHSRNSGALYANDYFAGHKLLQNAIFKRLFPQKSNILDINYPKIDIKLSFNLELLKIYFQNEFNWLYQKIRKLFSLKTSYEYDLENAKKSLEIQKNIEKITNINLKTDYLPAIEIIFHNQKNHNISSHKLNRNKIIDIFGKNNIIKDIIIFKQDNVLRYDIHQINSKIAQKYGARWLENEQIVEILMDGDNLAGIVTKEGKYIYVSKLHLSLGYNAKYQFSKDIKIKKKLSNNITATGISMVVIIKNSLKSKKIFDLSSAILLNDIYVSFIAKNNGYILLKIAGGANIGSKKYKNSYFFNILEHLKIIFENDLIGILSCYACCRSINGQNSTKFTKIGQDIIISNGKGGSGNSKRYYEGDFALNKLCS